MIRGKIESNPLPLRRYIFNMLTVVSLLLLLVVVGLWVDSYWVRSMYMYVPNSGASTFCFINVQAEFALSYVNTNMKLDQSLGWEMQRKHNTELDMYLADWSQFTFKFRQPIRGTVHSYLAVPHWFLTLIFAIGLPSGY